MAVVNALYAYPLPAAIGILSLFTSTLLWIFISRPLNKIDGPKGNIFVGIGLSLPSQATRRLRDWAQQYGEVYKIRIGWYYWVVLSSPEAIKEVFDKLVNDRSPHITRFTIPIMPRCSRSHVRRKCQHRWGS